jgi:Flp pilus assembly protein protease CpaA
MHPLVDQPSFWVALTMLAIAAMTDLRSGLIPNMLVLIGAGMGVLVQLLAAGPKLGAAVGSMLLGLVACSIVPAILWLRGVLGGGDLKLFAATGLCVGPAAGLDIQLAAHLLAIVPLPLYFLRRGGTLRTLRGSFTVLANLFRPAARRTPLDPTQLTALRFAPAIFAGALWVSYFGGVVP